MTIRPDLVTDELKSIREILREYVDMVDSYDIGLTDSQYLRVKSATVCAMALAKLNTMIQLLGGNDRAPIL